MNYMNGKLFIPKKDGVIILHDKSARQFLPTHHFDYNSILGLDKPMNRVKALTGIHPPQNCSIGKSYKRELTNFEYELGLLLSPEVFQEYLDKVSIQQKKLND